MSNLIEVAAKVLELKAALVRAGCSGELGLAIDNRDVRILEKTDEHYAHRDFQYFSKERTLVGCVIYSPEQISYDRRVVKEYFHHAHNEDGSLSECMKLKAMASD